MASASAPSSIQPLRWNEASGRIEMIDQRALPARFEVLTYDSAADMAAAIRSMVVRGAPAIGCAAAYGVAVEARRLQHLSQDAFAQGMRTAFEVLAQSRPTAVNLFWALRRMQAVFAAAKTEAP